MNQKPNPFEKISSFITGKGFYLVVLVCVAAIALSGLYLVRSVGVGGSGSGDDEPVGGTAAIPSSPLPTLPVSPNVTVTPSPAPKDTETPSPKPSAPASPAPTSSVPSAPAPSASPAALVFTWPLNGTVISGHSVEVLAYDITMGDWRTHAGLDIAAPVGTKVMAAAAGTVSAIYEDDLLGTTVVIDHGRELVSIYSNLAEVPTVKVGDTVSTGTVIGSVGSTASAESRLEPHLHFALFLENRAVDPADYLPDR